MEEIDELIKETLSAEEAAFYDALDEQSIFGMLFGLFKGRKAWINIVINIAALVFFCLFIYFSTRFFSADSTSELVKWGFVCMALLISISMLKLYAFMQMDKNALLREMKRLELQVMSLSGKLKS